MFAYSRRLPSRIFAIVSIFVAGFFSFLTPISQTSIANATETVRCVFDITRDNYRDCDFSFQDLSRQDFTNANLRGANFTHANLSETIFANVDASGATFDEAFAYKAKFSGANVTNTSWRHAFARYASFNNAIMSNSQIDGLDLQSADVSGITTGGLTGLPTNLPEEFRLMKGYLAGPAANLKGADLSGLDLDEINLMGADLTGTISGGISGFPSMMPAGWTFYAGHIIGKGVSVAGLNLATLDLRQVDLTGIRSGGVTGTPSLPAGWRLIGGYLIGPGANLRGANLANLNLCCSGSTLRNVISGEVTGSPSLPAGWIIRNGYLVGRGADLRDADLSGTDLSGTDLSSADLEGANVSNANLSNVVTDALTKLSGVKSGGVIGIRLTLPIDWRFINGYLVGPGANLKGAALGAADLHQANLDSVISGGVTGTPILPSGWRLTGGYLLGLNADISGADLSTCDLSELVTLRGLKGTPSVLPPGWKIISGSLLGPNAFVDGTWIDLDYLDLSGLDLSGATLTNIRSRGITGNPILPWGWKLVNGYLVGPGAILAEADLSDSNLDGVELPLGHDLEGVTAGRVTGNPILPAAWKLVNGYLAGPGAVLAGADLSDANLDGLSLRGAHLRSVNLDGVELSGIDLYGIYSENLSGSPASLPLHWALANGYLIGPGVHLDRANLAGANLAGVSLTNADFFHVDISGANIDGADFSGAFRLYRMKSGNLTGQPILSTGWTEANGYLLGPDADLTGANLTGINLNGVDLSSVVLDDVTSGGLVGVPKASPSGWRLRNGYFIGPNTNVQGANLDGLDLHTLNLHGVVSGGVTGSPILPAGWIIRNGFLVGPYANLRDADLHGADLQGASLSSADLQGANLQGANLTMSNLEWVKSGGIIGVPTLPQGWQMVEGYIVGRRTNLTGADLRGADLSGLNLTESRLEDALLTNANMEGTTYATGGAYPYGLKSGGITGVPNLGFGVVLINGYLITTGVDLTGADLSHSDLSVIRSFVDELTGNPLLPDGYYVINGYLTHPTFPWGELNWANQTFVGMNFSNYSLRGFDLRGTTFIDCQFSNADFSRARLNNTLFIRSNLTDARFSDTWLDGASLIDSSGTTTLVNPGWNITDGLKRQTLHSTPRPEITGIAVTGQTLTANLGNWDSGVTKAIQWLRDSLPVSGATENTYVLTSSDFNHSISVRVTGTKVGYQTVEIESAKVTIGAATLLLTPKPIIRGEASTGQTLTVDPGTWDSGVVKAIQWLRDGVAIGGATATTYVVASSDFNHSIGVRVTGTKDGYLTVAKESSPVSIGLASFLLSPTPGVVGKPATGQTLSVSVGIWDTGASTTIQWLRDGLPIIGVTGTSYVLVAGDVGHDISVKVTAEKVGFTTTSRTSSPQNVVAGTLTLTPTPTVSGSTAVGKTLSVTTGTWDSGVTKVTQWLRDGQPISTLSTYLVGAADLNHAISVKVTVSKPGYVSVTKTTAAVTVLQSNMTISTVSITGTAVAGKTLTAKVSAWAPGAKLAYQWLLDGKAIAGATKATYTLLKTQKARKISVRVTQTAVGYNTGTGVSAALKVG